MHRTRARSRVLTWGLSALLVAGGLGAVVAAPASGAPTGGVGAWGLGTSGQLGNGASASSTPAVSVLSSGVLSGKTVIQVAAGAQHACAVTSDGLVACWGDNAVGQLGNGAAPADSNVPVAVTGGTLAGKTATQVSAGTDHTCAVTSDGAVSCWGSNAYGQLGNGSAGGTSAVPVAVFAGPGSVLGGKTVSQLSAGGFVTCAVADGAASCWGRNIYGGLGDGTETNRSVPVPVFTGPGGALAGKTVTQVSAGVGHTCARTSDGGLACWGWNSTGQLGVPTVSVCSGNPCSRVPLPLTDGVVPGSGALAGRTVAQVSAGYRDTCAATTDGAATCWGLNDGGQVGDGTTTQRVTPVLVATPVGGALTGKKVTQVSSSMVASSTPSTSCARADDGTIACWGSNLNGGLGIPTMGLCGATPCSTVPVSVTGGPTPGSGVMAGSFGIQVSCGQNFVVALTATTPGAPTGVTAAPGDGKATVSWTAPASNGGSAITGYVVQQSVDAGTTWTPAAGSPAGATATSLEVTGLTNGINVSFRVAATNAVGQGPYSTPSVPVTPTAGVTATVTVTSPAASGSQISSNGYFGVSATSTGIPAGTTAYVTLNGSAKASTTVQAGGNIRFDGTAIGGNQWIPAEAGNYAVRIGGGGTPVLATSSTFSLVIIPFGLTGRSGNRYTVQPGNFSPGTTVYLTRNSATVASGKVQTKEQPFTITGPTTSGTYQIWVASNQGRVYGDHAGVITIP